MSRPSLVVLLLLSCGALASDSTPQHSIRGRIRAVGAHPSRMRVHLNGAQQVSIVAQDGSFEFNQVASGSHVVEVVSTEFAFEQVKVSISRTGQVHASFAANPRVTLPYPLFLEPKGMNQYFEVREPMNFSFILKNPMVMMMGFTMLMVMVLPKMMDPETMKEMQEDPAVKTMFGVKDEPEKQAPKSVQGSGKSGKK
eukprot:TRINITY_DN16498_c0_g1_i1.p1 TRINITY_DN16498_c0_g1~~TRINITY_DN16498_c0_g1_i1.p1  ORF type:complete len:197 (+),score=42.51 TRINITY_DN16498_c0_g1_i1:254-844(+)